MRRAYWASNLLGFTAICSRSASTPKRHAASACQGQLKGPETVHRSVVVAAVIVDVVMVVAVTVTVVVSSV